MRRADERRPAVRNSVIAQGIFLDLENARVAEGGMAIPFVGFADFLVGTDSRAYWVQDSKLARRAKVAALLQIAAYAEQLEWVGMTVDPEVELILGNHETSINRLDDTAPVLREHRK